MYIDQQFQPTYKSTYILKVMGLGRLISPYSEGNKEEILAGEDEPEPQQLTWKGQVMETRVVGKTMP